MYFAGLLGIGGTHFHYAAGTTAGEVRTEIHTERTSASDLAGQITRAIDTLQADTPQPLDAIAVASKGLVDRDRGRIELMNIKGGETISDVRLVDHIQSTLEVPVYLENDCTAAALAEYHLGAGASAGYDSIAHITIGTGIGAGFIDGGRIVRGESNFAGEVGSIRVGPPDGLEWCGIPGAWEAYGSGPGIAEFVRDQLATEARETRLREVIDEADPTPHIFELAKAGDTVARAYVSEIAQLHARGVATVANLFDPGLITFGGGVATNNPELVVGAIEAHLDDLLVGDRPEIRPTGIDNMGIYGALAQVIHGVEAELDAFGSVAVAPDVGDD